MNGTLSQSHFEELQSEIERASGFVKPTVRMRNLMRGLTIVYELIDPRDNTVFYVGSGKYTRMLYDHEHEVIWGMCTRKCNRMREIAAAGAEVRKRIVSVHRNKFDARTCETTLVHEIGYESLTNGSRAHPR